MIVNCFAHCRAPGSILVIATLCCIPITVTHRFLLLGLGNCGKRNGDGDLILAIGIGLYNRNGGSNCDQVSPFIHNLHTSNLTSIVL